MKTLSTAIVTALLALGVSGNAAAHQDTFSIQQMTFQNDHQASHQVRSHRHDRKKVVKRVAKRKVYKAPSKRIAKKKSYKAQSKRYSKKKVYRTSKRVKRFINKRAKTRYISKRVYRVRPGDTLSRIAARKNISLQKLIRINRLWGDKANKLSIGMVIRLA